MFNRINKRGPRGHNLLETIVATGVFVLIAVGLSGVWVMYGNALAKSGEYVAANNLARAVTEGLISNGFEWLEEEVEDGRNEMEEEYLVVRRVRGRSADIKFSVVYYLTPNEPGNDLFGPGTGQADMSPDIIHIGVRVRWHSASGSEKLGDDPYNNSVRYSTMVYKDGI